MSDNETGVQRAWQARLDQGEFMLQQCGACDRHVFYPRELCPHCGADALSWVPASGQGTVYSVTTVRRKDEAGGDYNVSLVDLDEGVRMMSRVEGVAPEAVHIGMRVTAHVGMKDGQALVLFTTPGEQQ
ncbi:OB-fold domain-containing protein [Alcanivorax sp. JB21]|uniref:Zn-ribbon domain-containing OB-fold protein n=1 Tax=Alcanivorax limicola TaxID=2874102 RepID=UPI001CBC76D9|nr:OB-fold domain-containing protein [Alcanivorax limicola]MBZ2187551.1 OB-fold domain-containing protein [Alcanivorax limicola]